MGKVENVFGCYMATKAKNGHTFFVLKYKNSGNDVTFRVFIVFI